MRKYRAKKKGQETPKSKAAKKREKEKSAEKQKQQLKKAVARMRAKTWMLKVKLTAPISPKKSGASSKRGFQSLSSKYRAVNKVKDAMPNTPSKKVQVLEKIITPTSKRILESRGALKAKGAGDSVVRSLIEKMSEMKPNGSLKKSLRPGYCLLKKVINRAGAQARKACGIGRIQKKHRSFH